MAAKKQKRELTPAQYAEHVKRVVDTFKPLSEEQKADLARLFKAA